MAVTNVGQVSGIYIGSTKPTNTKLIWYDTSIRKHKFYDPTTKAWVTIAPQTVTALNYASLKNEAKNGLSVGDFYQITDSSYGNVLAIAVSSTRVIYPAYTSDTLVLDDLTGQKHYFTNSEDLTINGIGGTTSSSGKLTFDFTTLTSIIATDKILLEHDGKFGKVAVTALVANQANNLLQFISGKGLMVDIATWFAGVRDRVGGVVSLERFNRTAQTLSDSIASVSRSITTQFTEAKNYTAQEVTADKIYNKPLPTDVTSVDTQRTIPGKITKGSTLSLILQRIQSWFDYLRWARNIYMYNDFSFNNSGEINNSDNVQSAIEKLVYKLNRKTTAIMKLSDTWEVYGEEKENPNQIQENRDIEVAAGDTIDQAFAKAVKTLHMLGVIGDPANGDMPKQGFLHSQTKGSNSTDSNPTYTYQLNAEDGHINLYNPSTINKNGDNYVQSVSLYGRQGVFVANANAQQALLTGQRLQISSRWPYEGALRLIQNNTSGNGLYVTQTSPAVNSYGVYADTICVGALTFQIERMTDANGTHYCDNKDSFILADGTGDQHVYLPDCGSLFAARVIYIVNGNGGNLTIHTQGQNRIDKIGSSDVKVTFKNRGVVYMFAWQYGLYYSKENTAGVSCNGLWQVAQLQSTF